MLTPSVEVSRRTPVRIEATLTSFDANTDEVIWQLSKKLPGVNKSVWVWKNSVRAATTQNLNFNTDFVNGSTIDSVLLKTGDRILIKDQTDAKQNGIYVVKASGAPDRADDANTVSEIENAAVFVDEGSVNINKQFVLEDIDSNSFQIGSNNLNWIQLSSTVLDENQDPIWGNLQSSWLTVQYYPIPEEDRESTFFVRAQTLGEAQVFINGVAQFNYASDPITDGTGQPLFDIDGDPLYVLDGTGEIITDSNGNPVFKTDANGLLLASASTIGTTYSAIDDNTETTEIIVTETVAPASVPFYAKIDNEVFLVTARETVSGTSNRFIYSVERGRAELATIVATHAANTNVIKGDPIPDYDGTGEPVEINGQFIPLTDGTGRPVIQSPAVKIGDLSAAVTTTSINSITVVETITQSSLPFFIQIDNEIMRATSRTVISGSTVSYLVERGKFNSTPTTHNIDADVDLQNYYYPIESPVIEAVESNWSPVVSSQAEAPPLAPVIFRYGASVQRIGVEISSPEFGTDYAQAQFQFSTSPTFDVIAADLVGSGPAAEYRVPRLDRSKTFYVRARVIEIPDFLVVNGENVPYTITSPWSASLTAVGSDKVFDVDVESIAANKIDAGELKSEFVLGGKIIAGNVIGGQVVMKGTGIYWYPPSKKIKDLGILVGNVSSTATTLIVNETVPSTTPIPTILQPFYIRIGTEIILVNQRVVSNGNENEYTYTIERAKFDTVAPDEHLDDSAIDLIEKPEASIKLPTAVSSAGTLDPNDPNSATADTFAQFSNVSVFASKGLTANDPQFYGTSGVVGNSSVLKVSKGVPSAPNIAATVDAVLPTQITFPFNSSDPIRGIAYDSFNSSTTPYWAARSNSVASFSPSGSQLNSWSFPPEGWTTNSNLPSGVNFRASTYHNGSWYAIGNSGINGVVFQSSDLSSWSLVKTFTPSSTSHLIELADISSDGSRMVIVGSYLRTYYAPWMGYSDDGATWYGAYYGSIENTAANGSFTISGDLLESVVKLPDRWVAVGKNVSSSSMVVATSTSGNFGTWTRTDKQSSGFGTSGTVLPAGATRTLDAHGKLFSNGSTVMLCADDRVIYSTDGGLYWSQSSAFSIASGTFNGLYEVIYGNGTWYAVSWESNQYKIRAYSNDNGSNWNAADKVIFSTSPSGFFQHAIAFSPNLNIWLAVSDANTGSGGGIYTASDPLQTWTPRTTVKISNWVSRQVVVDSNGLIVVMGSANSPVYSSKDAGVISGLSNAMGITIGLDGSTSFGYALNSDGTVIKFNKTTGSKITSKIEGTGTTRPSIFYDNKFVNLVTQSTNIIRFKALSPSNLNEITGSSQSLDSNFTGSFSFYGAASFLDYAEQSTVLGKLKESINSIEGLKVTETNPAPTTPFFVKVDEEIIKVTGRTLISGSSWTYTSARGQLGSKASAHAENAQVYVFNSQVGTLASALTDATATTIRITENSSLPFDEVQQFVITSFATSDTYKLIWNNGTSLATSATITRSSHNAAANVSGSVRSALTQIIDRGSPTTNWEVDLPSTASTQTSFTYNVRFKGSYAKKRVNLLSVIGVSGTITFNGSNVSSTAAGSAVRAPFLIKIDNEIMKVTSLSLVSGTTYQYNVSMTNGARAWYDSTAATHAVSTTVEYVPLFYAVALESSALNSSGAAGIYCFDAASGLRRPQFDFFDGQISGTKGNAPTGGMLYDKSNFYTLADTTSVNLERHSSFHPLKEFQNVYVRYNFADAGVENQTEESTAAQIFLPARTYLAVNVPGISPGASRVRVYVRGADTDDVGNSFSYKRISTGSEETLTYIYGSNPADGFDTNFTLVGPWGTANTAIVPGVIKSETTGWELLGNGLFRLASVAAPTAPDIGSNQAYLFLRINSTTNKLELCIRFPGGDVLPIISQQ